MTLFARAFGILRIILLTLIFGFLFLDLFLRAAAPFSATVRLALWSPRDRATYDHLEAIEDLLAFFPAMQKPYSVHAGYPLDAHGFRSPPYKIPKTEGTFRLLTLGDSFTFSSGGVPYDAMWNTRIARMLEADMVRPVELINLGIPAAGPALEQRIFSIEGRKLSPDLVILGLFLGNDFSDESQERPPLERRWYAIRFLQSLSRLPALLRARALARTPFEPPAALAEVDAEPPLFTEKIYHVIELDRSLYFLPSWREKTDARIAAIADGMTTLRNAVETSGAHFLVMVIPDELQVNDTLKEELLAYGTWREFPLTEFQTHEVQRRMIGALEQQGISTLDLLPSLRIAAQSGNSPYALRNTHWNEWGNAVVADAIMEFLSKEWSDVFDGVPGGI